jgi:hypothetical protein
MVQIVPAALHSAAKCLPSDDKGKLFYSVQLRVPLPFWSLDVFFPSELTQYVYVNQFQSVIGAVSQWSAGQHACRPHAWASDLIDLVGVRKSIGGPTE